MSKEIDSFLNNQCMQVIIELANKNPNDMDLGAHVRHFITNVNKTKIKVSKKDLDN